MDAAFAQLEARYPQYRAFLAQVNALIDQYIARMVSEEEFKVRLNSLKTGFRPVGGLFGLDWMQLIDTLEKVLPLVQQIVQAIEG